MSTDSLSSTVADSVLNSILKGTAFTPLSAFVQLHTGEPGAAGTTNVAGESTRKAATFADGSGGSAATSADITWTSVTTAETYTHVSLWSASTAGTFIGSGTITASAVAVGDTFTISAGDLTVSIPVAA